jgi:hypothetical protein
MQSSMSRRYAFAFSCALAAPGCSQTYSVATSAGDPASHGEQPALLQAADVSAADSGTPTAPPRAPKLQSVISRGAGLEAIFNHPILGDVDGDGLDDFLLQASLLGQTGEAGLDATRAYLFYGRAAFPAQLSTDDADGVFESDGFVAVALGDVNGDGLADFALGGGTGINIVFGSPNRYLGQHPSGATGVLWTAKQPANAVPEERVFRDLRAVGDINGDHMADFLLSTSMAETFEWSEYVVLGHRDGWNSGEWDARWSAAELGTEAEPSTLDLGPDSVRPKLHGLTAADLDGDGVSDLLVAGIFSVYVFYGNAERFHGTLNAEQADASFPLALGQKLISLGDLDGDGADDLALNDVAQLRILYGSPMRLSGLLFNPRIDLTLISPDTSPSVAILDAHAGDVDGDGAADLVIQGKTSAGGAEAQLPSNRVLYTLRGTGARLTGEKLLSDGQILLLGPESDFAVIVPERVAFLSGGSALSVAGDVDGDGSVDVLSEGAAGAGVAVPGAAVTLIPSTPKAPD